MKTTFTFLIMSLVLASCSSDGYTIMGSVSEESNGQKVYLEDFTNRSPGRKIIDSTTVVDGAFEFTGSSETPSVLIAFIKNTQEDDKARLQMLHGYALTENNEIILELTRPSKENGYVSAIGSSDGLNGELAELDSQINDIHAKMSANYENKDAAEDVKKEVHAELDSLKLALLQNSIGLNKDNILGVYSLNKFLSSKRGASFKEVDSLFNVVTLAKNYKLTTRTYDRFKALELTSAGHKFTDFSGENVDGTPAKLSDYVGKGKYVLVDFWASWCGPCTREVPNLRYVHDNYPELVVLGVNVWDSEAKFHSYIKSKNITWPMLYASADNTATDLYGINGIPTIILFDPQGVIVDRTNLRGEDMKKIIGDLYKK